MSKKLAQARKKKNFSNRDLALNRSFHDITIKRFYDEVGREEITEALSHSPDPRVEQLLELIYDPDFKNYSFARLCQKVGLTLGDIIDAFRRYQVGLGIIAMAKKAPKIMSDTAADAESTLSACMSCRGTGTIEEDGEERPCPSCLGEGSFRVPGHEKSRELFFKTMGLIGKKGPLVAQQFNISDNRAPRMEDFVIGIDKLMREDDTGPRR